jgi:hypothetical protein
MKGHIEAESGTIGNWSIDWLHSGHQNYGKGIYSFNGQKSSGLGGRGDGGSVVFWAGCPGQTPWLVNNYDQYTPFYVLEDGSVYCTNIHLNGGEIK